MKYWIAGGSIINSCRQGRPRRLQALFGNLSRLFRAQRRAGLFRQSGARCPSSLGDELPVLDTILPQQHTADSTSPTNPHPLTSKLSSLLPGPEPCLTWCRSFSQAGPNHYHLSILPLLRWPIHDHCICDFHYCPAARAGCALLSKPNLSHSFLTRPQLGVVDGLRNRPFTYGI